MGGGSGSGRHARNLANQQYQELKGMLLHDPALNKAYKKGGRFWKMTGLPKGDPMQIARQEAGRAAADITRGMTSAMASRGGGGVGSTLGLLSRARGETMTGGVAKGYGMQLGKSQAQQQRFATGVGLLNSILQSKYGALNQAFGSASGVYGQAAQASAMHSSGIWQGVGTGIGGALS
jgi:hypothetical protein